VTAALAFRRPRHRTAVVPALVLAYALATLVAATPARTTTYAGAAAAARGGDLAAGLG